MKRNVAQIAENKVQEYKEKHEREADRQRQPQHRLTSVSYANVVATNTRNLGQRWTDENTIHRHESSHSSIQLDIPMDEKKWFIGACVGRLKNLALFDRVEEELSWDERVHISPKYLGDDMVLLLGLIDARAEQMAKEETMNGSSLFHSLEKWNSRMRIGYRLIWVQCLGILLLAWDMVQIQKIVAAIGEMVEVDDDVEEAQRLDRARVLIKTPW